MKRSIQAALVVATLLNGSYALADDPANVLLAKVTRADMYAGELAMGNTASAFPSEAREDGAYLASKSTHADRHSAEIAQGAVASAFPSSVDDAGISLVSKSTYADSFAKEPTMQARGASDPALSR